MKDNKNRTVELLEQEVKKTETVETDQPSNQSSETEDVTKNEPNAEQHEQVAEETTQTETSENAATSESTEEGTSKSVYYTEEGRNILDLFQKLAAQVDELKTLISDSNKSVTTETVTTDTKTVEKAEEKVEKSVEDRVSEAVAAALAGFKKEHLDALTTDLQAVKTSVEEIASQPIDKSHSVRGPKEGLEAIEKFHARVGEKRTNDSIIGAAVRIATGAD